MDAAVEGLSGSARPASDPKQRRVLVINLDARGEFSLWCRRLALDLYRDRERLGQDAALDERNRPAAPEERRDASATRQAGSSEDPSTRASNVDFWDVRDAPPQPDAREVEKETDSIWRYWPRPIRGGAKGAIAELEEKLSEELVSGEAKQLERLTVLVIASFDDLKRRRADEPSRVEEFLESLQDYFRQQPEHRRSVQVALALNNWDNVATVPPLRLDDSSREKWDIPDAVVAISRRHMTTAAPPPEDAAAFQMKLLRIVVDLFRSDLFATSFFMHARSFAQAALVFRIDTISYELYDRMYAATAMRALRRKHADAQKELSNPVAGEADPFIEAINELIFGVRAGAGSTPTREYTSGSYSIINEVTKSFDKHIFPDADRRDRLIKRRYERLVFKDDQSKASPRWLFGFRWSQAPLLEILLERAFVDFLQDTQAAIKNKLAGQESQLARHERAGVRERVKQVEQLGSALSMDKFGTGERAKSNARDARAIVEPQIDQVEHEISQFWERFAEERVSPVDDKVAEADIEQVREHCPLIRVEWPEAQSLLARYRATRNAVANLMSRPAPWFWIVVGTAICLQIPLLWLGVWSYGFTKISAIPALSLAIWAAIFVLFLGGPWWKLKAGHHQVEKRLRALDAAGEEILVQMEERLADIVKYVAIIQRHYFLHRLKARIDVLATEAGLVDAYLHTVEASLGVDAANSAAAGPANLDVIMARLQNLPERSRWLDVALRHLELASAATMEATLPGGAAIRTQTCLWRRPIAVRVEALEPAGP
jgi:hypothetical protein